MLRTAETLDMPDFPDIIHTDVVTQEVDAFWTEKDAIKQLVQKNLLVITSPFQVGTDDETQLTKIIAACQLTEDDYQVLQINDSDSFAWHQINKVTHPRVILLFGIKPQDLGISSLFIFNYPNNFDKAIWIPTLSLQELAQQPEAKKQLWGNALKPIFVENK